MKRISSVSNDLFKVFASLGTSAGLKKHGLFILSGRKLVEERSAAKGLRPFDPLEPNGLRPFEITHELLHPGLSPLGLPGGHQAIEFSSDLFKELDTIGTKFNLLVCRIPEMLPSDFSSAGSPDPSGPGSLEIISPLGDPQNLGAIVRSAAAFGVRKIHLTMESCHPFHPKALKASANGVFHVEFFRAPALSEIQISESLVYVLDSGGRSMKDLSIDTHQRKFLLIGEEGQGISQIRHFDKNWHKVSIPIKNVESLNASVAASLLIYHL